MEQYVTLPNADRLMGAEAMRQNEGMRASLAMVALCCAGCVTQATYDKLQADYDESQSQLEARNKSMRDCEQLADALKQRQGETTAELDRQKEAARELAVRIQDQRTEVARIAKDKASAEMSIAEMTAAIADLEKRKEEADARLAEFKGLLEKFRTLIHAGKLKVKIVDGRMVVVLGTDILFRTGSSSLSKEGRGEIAEVARLLASLPKRKFQVEGHTDNVRIATSQFPSNWELAGARAITVVKAMADAGMLPEQLSAASFGEHKPAVSNDAAEGRAANRRIEIILVPDLSTLPGFDELNRAGS
jgi:chemotaxis protein MotB